ETAQVPRTNRQPQLYRPHPRGKPTSYPGVPPQELTPASHTTIGCPTLGSRNRGPGELVRWGGEARQGGVSRVVARDRTCCCFSFCHPRRGSASVIPVGDLLLLLGPQTV